MTASRAEDVARQLGERILDGTIAPGERLPSEARLVEEFAASRSVVREALQRLQTRGLVRTRVGSGSYALTPPAEAAPDAWLAARTERERAELHELRIALETESAALAAARRSDAEAAEIDRALEALARAELPSATVEADFAFHRSVASASANRYLLALLDRLGPRALILPRARLADERRDGERAAAVLSEHRAIADAIRRRDPLAASAAMRAHLASSLARRADG